MSAFLILAYLFFIGSLLGWVLEVLFRKFFSSSNPEHRWINPGFCVGPYIPLYGCGLCILYLLASAGDRFGLDSTASGRALLFLGMAVSMTLIEYIAGIMLLRLFKLRLWDYSMLWGNIQGLICPLFSFFWAVLGAIYYFLVHPAILEALLWLANNLAFSFVIGFFFGVFTIDVAYSGSLVSRMKAYADEHQVIVRVEELRLHIRRKRELASMRIHFFFQFQTERKFTDYLKDAHEAIETGAFRLKRDK
ncbi:MAG: putative ABC transporter permease [Oscillospiraceae bacterium]|nr:putative ABC transporter permease [Oscillospiraceae bacterium]